MKKVMDGCSAVSNIAYKFSELSSIYPITPASPMASGVDEYRSKNYRNLLGSHCDVVEMQSEAGAIGAMHGSLQAGALSSTFTASQGLLLMIPNMYKIAGEGLPGVIHVASRTIATHALSIFGDHSDVYATRQTGFCMIASSSVQEAHDLAAITHLAAISSSMPFLHFMDGFRTSHEVNKIDLLDDEDLLKLIDWDAVQRFRDNSLNINHPVSRGLAENEDIYFQSVEGRNKDYDVAVDKVVFYMNKINDIKGTSYKPFNYYGVDNAKYVIVAMGSVTSTIKKVVDDLNAKGHSLGLIVVHLYRPFSKNFLIEALPKTVKRIAVLDRTKEAGGTGEPLYLDVLCALKDLNVEIYGGRYGLASKNTTPSDIFAVFDMLENSPKENFTIGIEDDVTNLSLPKNNYTLDTLLKEVVVYGYGSDGCVSASKDLLKIMGDEKGEYVQGYFEYDSKKSGGVTISHMRFSKNPIDLPFYPEHPNVLFVTKETYLQKFEVASRLHENGILIINTKKEFDDLAILEDTKKILKKRNITIFTIDAGAIAERNDLKGKISLVVEAILLKLLGVNDYAEILEKNIRVRFRTKGDRVINSNIKCVKEAILGLVPYRGTIEVGNLSLKNKDAIDMINARKGDDLKVSDLLEFKNGTFPSGLSKFEKRSVTDTVPVWDKENCIECGMCSLVCPHAVIRPFILEEDEKYAEEGIALVGDFDKKYKYLISVSEADCTGCGLCVEACPGKNGEKALKFGNTSVKRQKLANTLFNFYKNPKLYDKFTIKGSQLEKPKFEFSGACAGCGETPYLKMLSQLFGDRLIIANATGCSSIYGGSAPSTPYSVPWANSLFEDNAEFGFGILLGYKAKRNHIKRIMESSMASVSPVVKELFETWIHDMDDFEVTREVKSLLEKEDAIPKEIKDLMDYVEAPSIWTVGGDGWAYDIGFSGIDHVLSSGVDANILVLDTEVYSNTGGQASKASQKGQVAEFANMGKRTPKKDLFRIAMSYPDTYVASISLGANMFQAIKAFKEAEEHKGPSIIIAYAPCIEQGIKKGMNCSVKEAKMATDCGYNILMRYKDGELTIDSREPDFDKYEEFLNGEVRYNALKIKDERLAEELVEDNKKNAQERYIYYKNIASKGEN